MFIKIKNYLDKIERERGQAALTIVLALLTISTVLVLALGISTFSEVKKLNNIVKSAQSYYVAEGGIEDALIRVKNKMSYPTSPATYTLTVGTGTTTVEIILPLDNLTIESEGKESGRVRKLAINLVSEPATTNVDFNYGVQVGAGGLTMKANTLVNGNVFSDGPINGVASLNAIIRGDGISAVAEGTTGIDQIKFLKSDPMATDGNGHADTIRNSDLEGIPFCDTGSGNNKLCDTSEDDPTPIPLPITDAEIDIWKGWAAAGGSIGPYTLTSGGSDSLGPIKIIGDMVVESNSTLTVTGPIWVTGNIDFSSNVLIILDSSFGADESTVIIADGKIDVSSNVTICGSNGGSLGSCNPENGSYIMLLSTDPFDPVNPAIVASSDILASILYANNGAVRLESNVALKTVTGYALILESNSAVIYESGLANVKFSSGPGATFNILSWQEII